MDNSLIGLFIRYLCSELLVVGGVGVKEQVDALFSGVCNFTVENISYSLCCLFFKLYSRGVNRLRCAVLQL